MNKRNPTRRHWLKTTSASSAAFLLQMQTFAGDTGNALPTSWKARLIEAPKPVVAVDNVCAWPNLTVLPEDTIIATIFNQPCHGTWEGDVECWANEDNGQTWSLLGTPAPHEPGTNRMNVAAGLAANGDLLVLASGWSHRPPPGQSAGHDPPAEVLIPWICRSTDGGQSWNIDREAFPLLPNGKVGIPFGDILPGADGALRAALYTGARGRTYVFRSDDDGKSWSDPTQIDSEAVIHEPALFHLDDGKWLAAARYDGLELYRSEDDAQSWQPAGNLTGPAEHPGHFLRLADGRLLLTYGNRNEPRGVDVRFSNDEGLTWSDPQRVADFQGDGGYPSSVQLSSGEIVSAFYARRTDQHPRYHMGVVVW